MYSLSDSKKSSHVELSSSHARANYDWLQEHGYDVSDITEDSLVLWFSGLESSIFGDSDDSPELRQSTIDKFNELKAKLREQSTIINDRVVAILTEADKTLEEHMKNAAQYKDVKVNMESELTVSVSLRSGVFKDSVNEVMSFNKAFNNISLDKKSIMDAADRGQKLIALGTAYADKRTECKQLELDDRTLNNLSYDTRRIFMNADQTKVLLNQAITLAKNAERNFSQLARSIDEIERSLNILDNQSMTYSLCETYAANYYRAYVNMQLCVRNLFEYIIPVLNVYKRSAKLA